MSQRRDGTTSTLHADALGTTRAVTDDAEATTDTNLFDAWGNEISGTGSTVLPFKWVGRWGYYADSIGGVMYIRARIYQPQSARWNSVDPLELYSVLSPYAYAQLDPLNRIDPSGLFCQSCCCCAEDIVGPWGLSTEHPSITPGRALGHYFELLVRVRLVESDMSSPCKLEYWEWTTPNSGELGPTKCWQDSVKGEIEEAHGKTEFWCNPVRPGSLDVTWSDWCVFMHPNQFPRKECPKSYEIPLHDVPAIRHEQGNVRRLYFHIIAKSSDDCMCWWDEATWEGCQFLEIGADGQVRVQEFHVGADNCQGFPRFDEANKCKEP